MMEMTVIDVYVACVLAQLTMVGVLALIMLANKAFRKNDMEVE
jgi:hypothetical protein